MSDEAELLRQIVERPDDLALRQVYADLLLAREHPRGELIRLETELAALPADAPNRLAIANRITELVRLHQPELVGEIGEHVATYRIVGGFVDRVRMNAGAFRLHGERLFKLQPIRLLKLHPLTEGSLDTLVQCGHLSRVRHLELALEGTSTRLELRPLLRARLDLLEELEINNCIVAGPNNEGVFATLAPARLSRLTITNGLVGARVLRGLAANRTLCDRLTHLTIEMIPRVYRTARVEPKADAIADRAFGSLVTPRLHALRVMGSWFTGNRVEAFVGRTPSLREVAV